MRFGRRFEFAIALALIAVAGASCAGSGTGGSSSGGGVAGGSEAHSVPPARSATGGHQMRLVGPPDVVPGAGLPPLQPKVIKTADVSVGVSHGNFGKAFNEARAVADRFGGYNIESSTSSAGRASGTIQLRVPSASFMPALNALEKLDGLGHLRSEQISGRDVTSEFVDLKARLGNLASQRRVLLRLMDRAKTISDSIRVEDQLRGVELQMEQIKGRLRYLDNEATFSTISATITTASPAPAPKPNVFERAWDRMVSVSGAIFSAILIGAAAIAPIAALALLALLGYRVLRPRFSS